MSPIPDFIGNRPKDRLKLGCVSCFCLLISAPLVFALFMNLYVDRQVQESSESVWARFFFEMSVSLFVLSAIALLWAIFQPKWAESFLHKHSFRAFVVAFLVLYGTLFVLLLWNRG